MAFRISLPAAAALASLAGCNLLANLGQFDGAKAADAAAAADVSVPDAHMPEASPDTGTAEEAEAPDVAVEADAESGDLIRNPSFELGISPWTTFTDGTNMATLSVSTQFAHTGNFSGWVGNRTQTFQGTVQDIRINAVQGHTYTVSAWVRVSLPQNGATDAGETDAPSDSGTTEGGSSDAGAADADAGALDAATDAPSADDASGTGGPVGLTEPVDLTAGVTCLAEGGTTTTNYTRLGSGTATDSEWTEVFGSFTVPTCTITVLQIYVEGPAAGVDLYVDDFHVLP